MDVEARQLPAVLERTQAPVFEYYPNLKRLRGYVLDRLDQPISLGDAAGVAGLERKYFSAFFHRRVGIPFSHWVTLLRLARAIELIEREDNTLGIVAMKAGFTHRRTFERAFRKYLRLTPREFRRAVRPQPDWSELGSVTERSCATRESSASSRSSR
jgi:AraC-like DNA-binding protein